MQQKFIPYLMVKDASSAIDFYVNVFKAVAGDVQYGNTIPGLEANEEAAKTIIHAPLNINDNLIFLAEAVPQVEGTFFEGTSNGNQVQIVIMFDSKEEENEAYTKLSEDGGTIIMPLQDTFWGDTFGVVRDKFNITWQLSYNPNR